MYYTLRVYNQIPEPLDCQGTYILNIKLQKRTTTLDLAQATVDEQRGGGGGRWELNPPSAPPMEVLLF